MYKSYDYGCFDCGFSDIFLIKRSEEPDEKECPQCGGTMHTKLSAPTVLRASFADGQARGERWELAKKVGQLEHEASVARRKGDHEGRKEMLTEARKVGKMSLGKRDKTDK